jgi:hypothetical protein
MINVGEFANSGIVSNVNYLVNIPTALFGVTLTAGIQLVKMFMPSHAVSAGGACSSTCDELVEARSWMSGTMC